MKPGLPASRAILLKCILKTKLVQQSIQLPFAMNFCPPVWGRPRSRSKCRLSSAVLQKHAQRLLVGMLELVKQKQLPASDLLWTKAAVHQAAPKKRKTLGIASEQNDTKHKKTNINILVNCQKCRWMCGCRCGHSQAPSLSVSLNISLPLSLVPLPCLSGWLLL